MAQNSTSCTNAGSELLSFPNADHLEWTQKKQDLILNLGLSTANSETDETPTPTRFIRNCEEVGLFQDLQDVNPFDELFKKAVENPSSVNHLQTPVSNNSEDTLHTPQIYPELLDEPHNTIASSVDQADESDNPLIIALDGEQDPEPSNTSRDKLKDALVKKSGSITPVPINRLLDPERLNRKQLKKRAIRTKEQFSQREANRAAQARCRKRKQQEFEEMMVENKLLKNENKTLTTINFSLQETIHNLQEELKKARLAGTNAVTTKIETTSDELVVPVISSKPLTQAPPPPLPIAPQPAPIAPKNAVFSLPVMDANNVIGVPLQNVRNANSMVLVCPIAPESVILPRKPASTYRKLAVRKCR